MRKTLATLFAAGLLLVAAPARAADPYDLHVVLPITGGGAFLGKSVQENLGALETVLNKDGGIQGRPVRFVVHDDQSSPQRDVQIANELMATRPAVILGSAVVGLCNAMAPLMTNGPVMYCLSPSFVPAPNGYTFSAGASTEDQVLAIIRYMRGKGWTRIGVLNGIDATGQNADKAIEKALALPENKDMKLVEHQHFNPTDVSVAAQMERVKASGAQGLIAWSTGAPIATVFKAMIQAGVDIPVGTSSGNQIMQQLDQYASFLPKTLLIGSAVFPEHEGLIQLDPRVEQVQHDMYDVLRQRKLTPDIATSLSWDPGLIVVAALKKLGPSATAVQVRDHIRGLKDFAGINGLYDFTAHPDRGLGSDSATVVTYDPQGKRWVWLSKPGGTPLQ